MKKLFLTICLSIAIYNLAIAQSVPTEADKKAFKFDENTVVKDSSGKKYSYKEWKTLVRTQKYGIIVVRRVDGSEPVKYLLVHHTEAEQNRLHSRTFIEPHKPAESTQFHAGDVFKPFNEKDINGVKFNLKKDIGKVYMINFWFIGCPPCRAEIPDLNKIVDHYKDNKDVVFIAICLDEAYDIQNYLKMQPYNYHIIDGGRYIAAKYGVQLYPTNLVVNRDGKVAYSSVSNQPANPYWITKTIDEALQAPVSTTP